MNNENSNPNVCSKCGASLPHGSFVCLNCKTPLRFDQIQKNNHDPNMAKIKKREVKSKMGILVVAFAIIMIILLLSVMIKMFL